MSETTETLSPYDRIGGADGVRALADAFYTEMEQNPAYATLRAMHDDDLTPMRESLAGFFSVWLGGPRTWLEQRGGFCIMSRHAKMGVTKETADQWMDCMRHAIAKVRATPELAAKMDKALLQLADAMAWTAKAKATEN